MENERCCDKTLLRRGFAYLASVLMILVAFQVMIGQGSASESNESVVLSDSSSSEGDNSTVETNATGSSLATEESSLICDSLSGVVKAHGAPTEPSIGELGAPEISPRVVEVGDMILILTTYGKYVINSSHPESMALLDLGDRTLVRESYFSIELPSVEHVSIVPANGTIVNVTAHSLVVRYDLMTLDDSPATLGTMEVTTEFSGSGKPKITARLLELAVRISEWRIVWLVFPSDTARIVSPETEDADFPLYFNYETLVPYANSSASISVSSSVDASELGEFMLDWSDANGGYLCAAPATTLSGERAGALKVYFEVGEAEIDPYLVAGSSSAYPTDVSCQRKTFWYGGYYWVFFYDGSTIRYGRSIDGTRWSSAYTLPGGTQIVADTGFDVAQRDEKVAVVWICDTGTYKDYVYLVRGKILAGTIQWSTNISVIEVIEPLATSPPAVAIGSDGWYWVVAECGDDSTYPYDDYFEVVRANETAQELMLADYSFRYADRTWYSIMALANGQMALLETSYKDGSAADSCVRLRFWTSTALGNPGWPGWTSAVIYAVDSVGGIYAGSKSNAFSAVAEPDGTIHLAYRRNDPYAYSLGYSCFCPENGYWDGGEIDSASMTYPSICLDENCYLHVFYRVYVGGGYIVRHMEKSASTNGIWSSPYNAFYGQTGQILTGVSCWASAIGYNAVVWSERTSPSSSIYFGNMPIPSGTAGPATEPWERDGLSPYGTYFSSYGDNVAPGSGLLTIRQTEVSVTGRNGVNLEVSRLYSQPRYFEKWNGAPLKSVAYPYCDMGLGWGLDLPWMDSKYVTLQGGERHVIQWGNNGNEDEFTNTDGAHFILRKASRYAHGVHVTIYELMTSSGELYIFWDDYRLNTMGDLRDYQPGDSWYGSNYLQFSYDTSGRLESIYDTADRGIVFSYSSGRLSMLTKPDGCTVNYSYTELDTYYDTYYVLTSSTDSEGRVTRFVYEQNQGTNYCVLLRSVVFPTGAKVEYTYGKNDTVGTEVRSWLVTGVDVRDNATGALTRQTNFTYYTVAGSVAFTNVTERSDTRAIQGRTEYVFQSSLKFMSVTKKDSSGAQMLRTVTWYDLSGQPVRVDTYKGASESISFTEYNGYDCFGNVIFTHDAMGGETYASYANTNTQNSFQGGELLARTSSGKIFYESFDDWEFSDWDKYLGCGRATINGSANPSDAPSLQLDRTGSTGSLLIKHSFSAQANDFVIQASMMVSNGQQNCLLGLAGEANACVHFVAEGGLFKWYNGVYHTVPGVTCKYGVWYDVGFYVHYDAPGYYWIYINGTKRDNATLYGSGNIDRLWVQAGHSSSGPTTVWIDNIRVYKGLTVTINNCEGCVAELYDSKGEIIDRSRPTGSTARLAIPPLQRDFPPGYITMTKAGLYSFATPMMDIWGGDTYSMSAGTYESSLPKTHNGFGSYAEWYIDEGWKSGTNYREYTLADSMQYVANHDYAISGDNYHESEYNISSHYHGFANESYGFHMYEGQAVVQYMWLTEGMIPQEIMLQFQIGGVWKRAYWGGLNGADVIWTSSDWLKPSESNVFRLGDIPQVTGQWLQLIIPATVLSGLSSYEIRGILYGLWGGTARWDLTARTMLGVYVQGLSPGYSVKLWLDSGPVVSATVTEGQLAVLDLNSSGITTFPVSGYFEVLNGSALIYESPWIPKIYDYDWYTYSAPEFYVNDVRDELHCSLVGSLLFQDYGKVVDEKTYVKCSYEGDAVEMKSKLGTGWIYTRAGYDDYGNQLWSSDPTGRRAYAEYSSSDSWTYPRNTQTLSVTDWMDAEWNHGQNVGTGTFVRFTTTNSFSPAYSATLGLSNAPSDVYAYAFMYKDYSLSYAPGVFVRMYVETYQHNKIPSTEQMFSLLSIHLYDSSQVNYATYSYVLSCWDDTGDNSSTTDPYTKIVWGKPPMGRWLEVFLYPDTDWNVDWSRCVKVRYEFRTEFTGGTGDAFTVYYDDFTTVATTSYTWDTETGLMLSATDPLGRKTNYSYDALGRVIWTQFPDNAYMRTVFDDTSNKATTYDEWGHKRVYKYDSLGRLRIAERFAGGAANYSWERYAYNWQDQVNTYRDAGGHVTTTTYDYLGRATRVTFPDMNYTNTAYDDINNLVTYLSYNRSSGAVTHKLVKVHDNLGRLNATREYTSLTNYNETLMTNDAFGNLLTVKDAKGQVTRMSYDTLNRLTRNVYPDGLADNVSYDGAGRVICKKDREGNLTFSYYGPDGQLVKAVSRSDTINTGFDAAGQKIWTRNSLGNISYAYNSRGMLTTLTQLIGTTTYTVGYTWDKESRLTTITYPDSKVVTYYYDSVDRVRDVVRTSPTQQQLLNITYNPDDTIKSETTGDGKEVTLFYYNSRDWPTTIHMKYNGNTRLLLRYYYDDVGNVKTLRVNQSTKARDEKVETYAYDWLDRIKSASGGSLPSGLTYDYDAEGNRIKKGSTTYTYGSNNKLIGDGTWSYSHDGNGNLAWKTKSSEQWKYEFDSLDQLTKVVKGTKSGKVWTWTIAGEYFYDANGARARTNESGAQTDYVYLGHDPLVEKSPTTYTDLVYVNGRLKAKLVGTVSTDIYYYIPDALGSTRLVWKHNAASATFSVATYAPFGTPVTPSGTEKFEYAGEMVVSVVGTSPGLYYISARWMDPELGRWLSLDPELGRLSFPQTLNRYVYCVNNPLRFTDPTGEFSLSKWWDSNWKTVAIIVAVAVITVATGGAGGVLAAMALGAVSQGAMYAAGAGSSFSWQGLAVNMGIGAAAGAVGYGAGVAISKVLGPKIAQAMLNMELKAAQGSTLAKTGVGALKVDVSKGSVYFRASTPQKVLSGHFVTPENIMGLDRMAIQKGLNPTPFNTAYRLQARMDFQATFNPFAKGGTMPELVLDQPVGAYFDIVEKVSIP